MVVSNGLGCSSCKGSKFIDEGLQGILEGLGDYATGQVLKVCDAKGMCTLIPANSYQAAAIDLNNGITIEQVQAKYGGSPIQSFAYSVAVTFDSNAALPAGVDPSVYKAAIADIVAGGNTYVAPKPVGSMIYSDPVAIPVGSTTPIGLDQVVNTLVPARGSIRNPTNIVSFPASTSPIPPGSSGEGTGTQPANQTVVASPGILDYLGFSNTPVDQLVSWLPNGVLLALGVAAFAFFKGESE